jgi:23S rRNA (uracil1939-C5)-methyltransferase
MMYGGDGLARLPPDDRGGGKAVFVPFVLEGETVEARLVEQKPGFSRARAEAVVQASPHRVQPPCPYFGPCGGCQYQHSDYEHQLAIKEEVLRENLRRIAKLDLDCPIEIHPSPPWNYRNRARLQVQAEPEFSVGYFELASHRLLPVERCPISSPLINRGIAALWQTGRAGKAAAGVREVEFLANADDTQLMLELACGSDARRASVRAWCGELQTALPEISGAVAFREDKTGRAELLISVGSGAITYQTRQASFRVSAGSFFQTNRYLVDELVNVVADRHSGNLALDMYAGVGLFSTALACNFRHIVSVEASQTAAADLKYNLPSNGEALEAETGRYLHQLGDPGRSRKGAVLPHALPAPDLVVVDPPRAGLGERTARALAATGARRLTYVSCDPSTLARDLLVLRGAGYRVSKADLIDLFPQTYHVESVLQLIQ